MLRRLLYICCLHRPCSKIGWVGTVGEDVCYGTWEWGLLICVSSCGCGLVGRPCFEGFDRCCVYSMWEGVHVDGNKMHLFFWVGRFEV